MAIVMAVTGSVCLWIPGVARGQTEVENAEMVFALKIENGSICDEGGELLMQEIAGAQFVLIGEDHGFANSPHLARAIFAAGQPYGMRHHVIETGPITIALTAKILAKGGVPAFSEFLKSRSLAAFFVNFREDAELAKAVLESDGGTGQIWGIDQEAVGSTLIHLPDLKELAPHQEARDLIASLIEKEEDAISRADPASMFLFSAKQETIAELMEIFKASSNALEIIAELEKSAYIYGAFGDDKVTRRAARLAQLRKNFLTAYRSMPEKAPRILFKMGAVHLGLGTTYYNTHDIGTVVEGVAAVNGLNVLRIAFVPLAGTQTVFEMSADGFYAEKEYENNELRALLEVAGVSLDHVAESEYTLIRTEFLRRELGQKTIGALGGESRFLVLGYDYIVTTQNASPATLLVN